LIIAAQRRAQFESVAVREPGIEDDHVWTNAAREVERLARVVGPQYRVPVGAEDRFERPGRPLLVIRDEHEQWARGAWRRR
jgi:hypothetical protein